MWPHRLLLPMPRNVEVFVRVASRSAALSMWVTVAFVCALSLSHCSDRPPSVTVGSTASPYRSGHPPVGAAGILIDTVIDIGHLNRLLKYDF